MTEYDPATSAPQQAKHVPDLSDLSDRTLGDFRLLRRLGVGGMAEVYLADQISLSRSVAVKILRNNAVSGADSVLLRRFEQEARAAGGLSHPNIVQVFMIGHDDDLNYIVQEYVHGQNLSQLIKREGPPEFLDGLKWMQQVASALKAASDAGIVHRDIKPENIMLTRSNEAKVTDFGLAQLSEKNERMNLTQAGTTMGTPWYMSPEQIRGEPLDHRSDQYSFGVTCYHMFAGRPPFAGRNSMTVAAQHLNETPQPLREIRRDLPVALCAAIHRMMAKQPEERFGSPDELVLSLHKMEKEPINAALAETGTLVGWARASLPPAKLMLAVLCACVLLGFIAGRRLIRPPRLLAGPPQSQYTRADNPQKQFAMAVLHSGNPAAWRAVSEYYPTSDEALWATLQLGVCYLEKPDPDLDAANRTFADLIRRTSLDAAENKELRFLALLGRAAVQYADRTDRFADDAVGNQLTTEYAELLENDDLDIPRTLRDAQLRLRDEFRG